MSTATPGQALLAELEWRGLLYDHTERLGDALAAGQVTGYCGFDPTAPSLHVGNLVPVMGLLHLQRTGHRPVILVGGGTGLIGDPSGKTGERPLLSAAEIAANAQALRSQLGHFLDFEGPRGALVRDNSEWLYPLPAVTFLRDVGKHFSVNVMLAKDSVKSRLEAGISFTEFAYMLLQAYDFAELRRRDGVTLQLGGSDQWGNITAGIDLIRRTGGGEAHGLVLPLVTTTTGTKFGKTEAGAVWLDPARTSPYRFFQFWINADDRDVGRYLRYFTLLTRQEVAALDAATTEHPERREAQQRLAVEVTTRVHGAEVARRAVDVSAKYRADVRRLTASELDMLKSDVPSKDLRLQDFVAPVADPAPHAAERISLAHVAAAAGVTGSIGEARRLIQQGGLTANEERISADDPTMPTSALIEGHVLFLQRGKRIETRTLIDFAPRS